jgi:hypothetical protein
MDSKDELLIPIQTHCKQVLGHRVAPATIWRWTRRGARGVVLDAVFAGGRWCCTRAAFDEFIDAQTSARLSPPPQPDSSDRDVDEQLRQAGLL